MKNNKYMLVPTANDTETTKSKAERIEDWIFNHSHAIITIGCTIGGIIIGAVTSNRITVYKREKEELDHSINNMLEILHEEVESAENEEDSTGDEESDTMI